MAVELVVRPSVDSAFLAWRGPFIENCRGFALARRIRRVAGSRPSPQTYKDAGADGFAEEWVSSWVGFADGPETKPAERQPTTIWPIQKYLWSDFMVNAGDQVAYRVVPMVGTAKSLKPLDSAASGWTPVATIGAETPGQISCFFNRGIVASQRLARLLPQAHPDKALREIIATPGDATRNFLGGPAREKLIELLQQTNKENGHIYAALFELNDPELIPLIQGFGKRAHIVLGNGSVKHKGDDENANARDALRMCDVRDRMTAPRALAHNKYLVLRDVHQTPQAVWTGSTNWTETGLCTQANNAVLIRNVALAHFYVEHWNALAEAGDASPPRLFDENATPHTANGLDGTTLWFTPLHGQADLEQAGELIRGAKEGGLFLMFNPGPRGTLLSDIIDLALPSGQHYDPDLYIQGVVNQNPGTAKNPVTLFNRGEKIDSNSDVVLPAAIPGPLEYWVKELKQLPGTFAMVHSKVIVIDPYGEKPVVMTVSHNMGPKASGVNDENLLLIEGDGELASQYAGNIMLIYSQYRWRQSVMAQDGKPKWEGLEDDDKWQIQNPDHPNDYNRRRLRELDFWFGRRTSPVTHPVPAGDTTGTDTPPDNTSPHPRPARRGPALSAGHGTVRKPARTTKRKR
jgi:hypothetical protein